MNIKRKLLLIACLVIPWLASVQATIEKKYVFEAGDSSLQEWLLPDQPSSPEGNELTAARVELGRKLFFDPRLSGNGNMACATCHNPAFGWSDGLGKAVGNESKQLRRATPTIVNAGYNSLQMWDGRKRSLEAQALGPMESADEMDMDLEQLFTWLNSNNEYEAAFAKAYPGEGIDGSTVAKALAAFERTVVSTNSPFDRWVRGNKDAMTRKQVNGFRLFVGKAKCSVCHSAPNFTDNGFHNLGLASFGESDPDMGRYDIKPLGLMKGAFKTPTLRDVSLTGPYFHDGSASDLMEVIDHYTKGGEVKTNLSPNMQPLELSQEEKEALAAFMLALTSTQQPVLIPDLPRE